MTIMVATVNSALTIVIKTTFKLLNDVVSLYVGYNITTFFVISSDYEWKESLQCHCY